MEDNKKIGNSKHPLHEYVGCLLSRYQSENTEVILDEACNPGGYYGDRQQISLFANDVKSRKDRLCKVDAMIVKDGKVKIILEIEESGFIPTKVCGKYLTSALSTRYIRDNVKMELEKNSILFIQIIDTGKNSLQKQEQLQLIEQRLNEMNYGCINKYKLLLIKQQSDCTEMEKLITDFLK
jgi:hypothetical protein